MPNTRPTPSVFAPMSLFFAPFQFGLALVQATAESAQESPTLRHLERRRAEARSPE